MYVTASAVMYVKTSSAILRNQGEDLDHLSC
jgi:hypothetical protein